MNHFNKTPDAHCRLAREARYVGVRGFGRAYQKNIEFKTRQMWLDFQDAVGTALEAIADVMDRSRAWYIKWIRDFVTKPNTPDDSKKQLILSFVIN